MKQTKTRSTMKWLSSCLIALNALAVITVTFTPWKLADAAETQVKEWKEQNVLYLPSFPQEKIAELAGSLDYPPTGSPSAAART